MVNFKYSIESNKTLENIFIGCIKTREMLYLLSFNVHLFNFSTLDNIYKISMCGEFLGKLTTPIKIVNLHNQAIFMQIALNF